MELRPHYQPQGTCPKAWTLVDFATGRLVCDRRGAVKRYATEASAAKAARQSTPSSVEG